MSLINREALYEKACGLEAQALAYVEKIANDETKIEEWRIWSAILVERTAFKHDIFDAPEVKPEPKWILCVDGNEPKANAECWISTNAKYVRRASYAPKANNQPNGFIVTDGGFGFYEYGKSAKAWMPYTQDPEPYRAEGD